MISSISDKNPLILRALQRHGLLPGTRLVVETGSQGAALTVTVGNNSQPVQLKHKLLEGILVVADP